MITVTALVVFAASNLGPQSPSSQQEVSGSGLIELVKKDEVSQLKKLLAKGLDVDRPLSHGTTLLMASAIYGKAKTFALIMTFRPKLDLADWLGVTALGYAAMNRRSGIFEKLVTAGASPDGTKGGSPPLIDVAGYGYVEYVERLLRAGANVDAQDRRGLTALMVATYKGHLEVVRTLLKAGADRNIESRKGETALSLAQVSGHRAIERLLVSSSNTLLPPSCP